MKKEKNAAAVELGRKGGAARVPKGLATMDPARAAEIQSLAGRASAAARRKRKNEKVQHSS